MTLTWMTCGNDNHWCSLTRLDLNTVNEKGVYVIWHGGDDARTVRVGMGDVKERLRAHQNDSSIMHYGQFGGLWVTWAAVPSAHQEGVENYLADLLKPLVGERFPNVAPIAVNSPW